MEELINQLSKVWTKNGYDQDVIKRVVDNIREMDPESFVKIPDYKFLECVKHLTNGSYSESFTNPKLAEEIKLDIAAGITFGFFIHENKLYWER